MKALQTKKYGNQRFPYSWAIQGLRFVSKRPIDFVFAVGVAGANNKTKEITEGESPTDKKIRKPTVSVFVGHPGLEPGTSRL